MGRSAQPCGPGAGTYDLASGLTLHFRAQLLYAHDPAQGPGLSRPGIIVAAGVGI